MLTRDASATQSHVGSDEDHDGDAGNKAVDPAALEKALLRRKKPSPKAAAADPYSSEEAPEPVIEERA